jgi:hypothetical protein
LVIFSSLFPIGTIEPRNADTWFGEAAEPDVSVRAVTLSLGRFGIASADEVKTIEKRWAGYRKMKGLDLYGKTAEAPLANARPCAHSDLRRQE